MGHLTTVSLPGHRPIPARRRGAPGRREKNKADVRSRLVRAAVQLFGMRGFTATTVEDITSAADVAKGTFFNYFPTKEHLLNEFGEMRLAILRRGLAEVQRGRDPVRHVLHRLLYALMEEPGRSPAMARCMILGALSEPAATVAQATMAKGRQILAAAMAIGQRRGEIRRHRPPAELARLFQQSFFGAMYLWSLHPHLSLTQCLDSTFEMFWAGAQAQGERARKRSS
jgi:TetR/AcrR family transcriptional regulator, cholesterol catabolism regulator